MFVRRICPRTRVVVALMIAAFSLPPSAGATIYRPTSFDNVVLSADAIVFASVTSIESSDEHGAVLRLGEIVPLTWRWPIEPRELLLPVVGEFQDIDAIRPFRHQPALKVGHRYLLLLKGGDWTRIPAVTAGDAIYEVLEDGSVGCPGGVVRGVGVSDFVCRVMDTESPAYGEDRLGDEIAAYARSARQRRPELASTYDRLTKLPNEKPTSVEERSND